jgi:hypothetical protein
MKTIPDPTTKEEIEPWMLRQSCLDLLGQDLVPSDSHDEEGAMMTENQEWYFVPCEGDFVMSGRTILEESKPTEKLRWRLEFIKCYSGGYMEPDDYDLEEIGERQDSLRGIIEEAAIEAERARIRNLGEGLYWTAENLKEKLGYYEY